MKSKFVLKQFINLCSKHKSAYILVVITSILAGSTEGITLILFGNLIDKINNDLDPFKSSIFFMSSALCSGLLRLWLTRYSTETAFKTCETLSNKLFESLIMSDINSSDKWIAGNLVATTTNYVNNASGAINQIIVLIVSALTGLIIIFTLLSQNFIGVIILGTGLILTYWIIWLNIGGVLTKNGEIIVKSQEGLASQVEILKEGLRGVKIYGLEETLSKKYKFFNRDLRKAQAENTITGLIPRTYIELSAYLMIGLIILVFSENTAINLKLGSLAALALGGQKLLPLAQQVYASIAALKGNMPALRKVVETITNKEKKQEFDVPLAKKGFSVKFTNKKNQIINAVFHDKKIIGIFAPSGFGKTSFVENLLGLRNDLNLKIYSNIKSRIFPNKKWMSQFSYIEQNTYIPSSNINDYLSGIDLKEQDQLEKILKEFKIDHIKQRMNGFIGENAKLLSGGEKQRLRIAKCLLDKRDIIILDEPTSKLDIDTENKVLKIIKDFSKTKMIILITHSNNALNYCDEKIALEI